MMHLIKGTEDARYQDLLEEHFLLRHDIFVRERGWTDLRKPDGREIDDYDNPDTVYLLATERNEVVGGYRFIPTIKRHLLLDHFSYLVEGAVPRGRDIWEWSRFFIRRDHRDGLLFRHLIEAVAPTCKLLSVNTLTCVIEPDWIARFEAAALPYHMLGPFVETGRMRVAAARLNINLTFARTSAHQGREMGWNQDC
ncbi:acyl-homoserine-lactone synthase [Chelativorans alearense]|uniref:acyl-homoserine-lactone synthase n=1 Tax=Chelativorans alearense TaxID=2681495 RepID=UPI0013D75F56|nr:acyl-homoserine-lactone synthase [Chelativorans alearense]